MKQWRIILLAIACTLTIVLSNCNTNNSSNQTANKPTPGKTPETAPAGALVYGSGGQSVNLEPGNIVDGNSIIVQNQIYNRLIETKPSTTELAPSLATEWKASPDGKNLDI